MNPILQRITTEYVADEDRIRLAGEGADGATVVIWLTQRLLQRLLPVLLQWLEQQGAPQEVHGSHTLHAELLQGFAQQAARAELAPQAPVQPNAGSTAWLAHAVDIGHAAQAVNLTFRSTDGARAALLLSDKQLRQWLGILSDATLKAEWPPGAWPQWLRDSTPPARGQMVLH